MFFFPSLWFHPTAGMRFTLGVPMTQVSALLKRMPSMQQRHHATTSFCRCSVDWGDMVIYSKMWCSIGDEVKKNETCYNWKKRFFRHLKPFLQNEGCVRGNPFTAFLLYHEGKTSCHNDLECMLAHLKSNQIHLNGLLSCGFCFVHQNAPKSKIQFGNWWEHLEPARNRSPSCSKEYDTWCLVVLHIRHHHDDGLWHVLTPLVDRNTSNGARNRPKVSASIQRRLRTCHTNAKGVKRFQDNP